MIIVPIMSSLLKWKDGTIGILALLGDIGSMFTIAFAVYPLMMYLGISSYDVYIYIYTIEVNTFTTNQLPWATC